MTTALQLRLNRGSNGRPPKPAPAAHRLRRAASALSQLPSGRIGTGSGRTATLEAATGYSDRLLHGEGVAIGMVMAHGFSAKLGLAPSQDTGRVEAHLKRSGLPTRLADIPGELPPTDVLMDAIAQDKKVVRGSLTFILTRGIGRSFIEKIVDPAAVHAFLDEVR